MSLLPYAQQVMERCNQLATISQSNNYIDRRYLTIEHKQANQQVAKWMHQAGMRTWQDEAGNQWGQYSSSNPQAKTLIIGSHLDTVPNSGKYDGILGVLAPISAIQALHDKGHTLPFHIQIVGFADEEGTRFGTTLLGSRAVSGSWQAKWASLQDANGVSVAQAMRDFGLNINRVSDASCDPANLLGFLELHIEQGPVLESLDLPLGIVDGIAGARRFSVEVLGQAGHAGTVPMNMRLDTLTAVAEMTLIVEKLARENQVVATVGSINCSPNAVNVINGRTQFSVDIRSLNNDLRDHVMSLIRRQFEDITAKRKLTISIKETHCAEAVRCDQVFMDTLSSSFKRSGIQPYSLPSGAGHDAMAMAEICPTGMIFMRCRGGISHHPAESIELSDVHTGLRVINEFFLLTGQSSNQVMVA